MRNADAAHGCLGARLCAGLVIAMLQCPSAAEAQAGPPFLTNDPGTPGNANWEINVGSEQWVAHGVVSYQVPQIDLNFGVGDRVQLTYEIPYVLQSSSNRPNASGWSNAYPGVKWRFLDEGEGDWQMSIFPQMETGGSRLARDKGIAQAGPRYLLPLEIAKNVGEVNLDAEAGYYVAGQGPKERILGFVAGRPVTQALELDAEIYDDRVYGVPQHSTTLNVGGRYRFTRGIIALFMAGRSVDGFALGRPEFIGYTGVQLLLSNFGRTWSTAP